MSKVKRQQLGDLVINGTCATAASTDAKVVTIDGYTLTSGDFFAITYTSGSTSNAATININGAGAIPVSLGGGVPTGAAPTGAHNIAAGGVALYCFTGGSFVLFGNQSISESGVSSGSGVKYGTCETAASTMIKVVTISGYTLTSGDIIVVKYTSGNTASLTSLNVNGAGAKPVRLGGVRPTGASNTGAHYMISGGTCTYYYDGTDFNMMGSMDVFDDTDSGAVSDVIGSSASQFKIDSSSYTAKYYHPLIGQTSDSTIEKITRTSNSSGPGVRTFTTLPIRLDLNIKYVPDVSTPWTAGDVASLAAMSRGFVGVTYWKFAIGQFYDKSGVLTANTSATDCINTPIYVGGEMFGGSFLPKEYSLTLRNPDYVYKLIGYFGGSIKFYLSDYQPCYVYRRSIGWLPYEPTTGVIIIGDDALEKAYSTTTPCVGAMGPGTYYMNTPNFPHVNIAIDGSRFSVKAGTLVTICESVDAVEIRNAVLYDVVLPDRKYVVAYDSSNLVESYGYVSIVDVLIFATDVDIRELETRIQTTVLLSPTGDEPYYVQESGGSSSGGFTETGYSSGKTSIGKVIVGRWGGLVTTFGGIIYGFNLNTRMWVHAGNDAQSELLAGIDAENIYAGTNKIHLTRVYDSALWRLSTQSYGNGGGSIYQYTEVLLTEYVTTPSTFGGVIHWVVDNLGTTIRIFEWLHSNGGTGIARLVSSDIITKSIAVNHATGDLYVFDGATFKYFGGYTGDASYTPTGITQAQAATITDAIIQNNCYICTTSSGTIYWCNLNTPSAFNTIASLGTGGKFLRTTDNPDAGSVFYMTSSNTAGLLSVKTGVTIISAGTGPFTAANQVSEVKAITEADGSSVNLFVYYFVLASGAVYKSNATTVTGGTLFSDSTQIFASGYKHVVYSSVLGTCLLGDSLFAVKGTDSTTTENYFFVIDNLMRWRKMKLADTGKAVFISSGGEGIGGDTGEGENP